MLQNVVMAVAAVERWELVRSGRGWGARDVGGWSGCSDEVVETSAASRTDDGREGVDWV